MKIKTSKLLAVLCTLAMMLATFVPMFTLSVSAADTEIVFNLGADGSASHYDGSSKTTYSETVDGYTLSLTNGSNFYTGARDAKGNSCIKLGTSSKAGSFSFTVPNDVTSVVIYVAAYKAKTATIDINGTKTTLTTKSDNGAYDEITVDTSSTKAINLNVSSGYRAMVNTIKFIISSGSTDPDVPACEHTSTTSKTVEATATTDGYTVDICDECGAEVGEKYDIVDALGYEVTFNTPNGVVAPTVDATVANGKVTVTMPSDATLPEGNYAQEYVFAGWAEVSVNADTNERPTLYPAGATVTLTKDTQFYAVYSYDVSTGEGATKSGWILSETIKAGDTVIITMTKGGVIYALNSSNGTSAAPSANTTVTVADGKITGTVADEIKWTVSGNDGAWTFHPNGNTSTWLYTTDANNGVRVGNNANKTFAIDGSYLKNTATNRYLGIYNTQDWRCYTTNTGNSNIANQTLGFYVLTEGGIETYYTSVPSTSDCDHADAEVVTVEPTCTENGSITTTCSCGYSHVETIDALGHDWDDGLITTQPDCTTAGEKTYNCNNGCGETKTETLDALGHNFVNGTCQECGEELQIPEFGEYVFSDYAAGTQYAKDELHELDDLLNIITTECHFTSELRIYSSSTHNGNAILQSIVPMYGLSFNAGNKVDTVNVYGMENSEWVLIAEVEVTSESYKDYTVDFGGKSYTQIKLDVAGENQIRIKTLTVQYAAPAEPEIPAGEITGVQLELGTDLSLRYQITVAEGESYESFKMVFTLGEKTVEATTTDGKFKLDGIAPDQMDDTITATLYKGDTVVDTLEYSIKAYLETIVNGAEYSAEAKSLAEAILIYGAAAQKHQNDTNAPVTDKAPNVTDADKPESDLSMAQVADKIEGSSVSFKSVGVRFSHVNKLYVALENDSAYTVTVKVNGNNAEIVDGYVYTNAISPADFDEVYTFELYVDGTLYQTVEYSVNSYISAKWNDASGLAKALYNYELAFVAYINQ